MEHDALLDLLRRFQAEGVRYILVGGHAVHVRIPTIEGVEIRTLDIDGLLKTKTDYRDKDRIDRDVLERLKRQL